MKAKIKIMKTRPVVSDDEITSSMDFDALLARHSARLHERRILRNVRNVCIGVIFMLGIPALVLFVHHQRRHGASDKEHATSSMSRNPQQIVVDSSVVNATPPRLKKEPAYVSPREKDDMGEGNVPTNTAERKPEEPARNVEPVYVQAEPADGYSSLYRYFDEHLVYPAQAVKDSIEGTVNVVFVIDLNGKATDIRIENSLGGLLDDEAIRLVQNMPPWKPATYDGQPVRSKISLPITFTLHTTHKND